MKRKRGELQTYFLRNLVPTQDNFADLIESGLNQVDDGIVKTDGGPVALQAQGEHKEVLHFYKTSITADPNPAWKINLNPTSASGLNISNTTDISRLFIKDDGNVGLGNTNPSARLEISGGGNYSKDLKVNGRIQTGDAAGNGGVWLNGPVEDAFVGNAGNRVGFWTSKQNWTALNINKDSGNVGIGTDTPQARLQVAGGIIMPQFGADGGIRFSNNPADGGGDAAWIRHYARSTASPENMTLEIGVSNDGEDHIALMPSGNVGIGTNEPKALLDIARFIPNRLGVVLGRLEEGNANGGTYLGVKGYGTVTNAFSGKSFAIEHAFYGQVNSSINFYRGGSVTGGFVTININNNTEQLRIGDDGLHAKDFIKYSDARVKSGITHTGPADNLKKINQIVVSSFRFKDREQKDTLLQTGFIAQEVEQVFPEAVVKHADFIPDIYSPAAVCILHDGLLRVTMQQDHGLQSGDQVRLILPSGAKEAEIIREDDKSFSVQSWEEGTDNIFVYGKRVNDYRSINYNSIFCLGIGAIQELYKQLQLLKEELFVLRERAGASILAG